jgi:hypothetical protein
MMEVEKKEGTRVANKWSGFKYDFGFFRILWGQCFLEK